MLGYFFRPRGVAIIGASRDPHKLGYGVVRNLVEYGFQGNIYPVNPVANEILGNKCYASIAEIPDPVDLAIVVVPAKFVAAALEECGKKKIKRTIVVSGGFGETGAEGRTREGELARIAKKYEMRIIGPNCIGTIDTHTPLNTTFVIGMPQVGDIAFVSQSGAMVAAVIDWARGAGVGFSRIVSLGNQVDVNVTEMLQSVADDPQTKVITAYIEGLTEGREFMEAAEEIARNKPVVVLKAGYGKGGAKAVASHTGALAGSAEAYDAAFEHSGVLRADTTEELFDWARALAWQPLPKGNRVAVLTNAGGPAILAVDFLEKSGLRLAQLTEETKKYLRPRLPAAASVNNPVDVLAGSGPATYAVALDTLISDPEVDGVIVIQAPQDWFLPESLAEVIGEVAAIHQKPVLSTIMGLASVDKALSILHRKRVPTFAFPERAASSLVAMYERRQWLDTPEESPVKFRRIDKDAARNAIEENDFSRLLEAYGISLPPSELASKANDAAAIANRIGYPVVLKLVSEDITHKSDVGGVVLTLMDEKSVRQQFYSTIKNIRAEYPKAKIHGMLVQKMITGGQEVIVGVRRDPQFGPVVLVGSGGVEVELQRDVSMGIAPLTKSQAERMLENTQAGKRLKGWRSIPPADKKAVIEVMLRMSQLACDFPEIVELEINPLFVLRKGKGAFAVDVRGVIGK
jgi:acetyl coenzyme A synthetase (ADP forming)-like protein